MVKGILKGKCIHIKVSLVSHFKGLYRVGAVY